MIYHKISTRLILFTFVFISNLLVAQNEDSLQKAKTLNAQHQYKSSIILLENWTRTHQDVNSLWYYAQTLHLAKKYSKSQEIYALAVKKYPHHAVLPIDYANKLAESGQLAQAIRILQPYADTSSDNQLFALQSLAKIYYWQGAYDQAYKTVQKALNIDPADTITKEWHDKIEQSRKNWVGLNLLYSKDNQPQSIQRTEAEGGYYLNDFASVGAILDMPTYNLDDKNYLGVGFRVFNILNFHELKAKSHIEMGIEALPNNETAFHGLLLLKKNIYRNLGAELITSHKPYLMTNTAILQKLMETRSGLAVTWNDPNGYMARTALDFYSFGTESNSYYTASIWALSPKLAYSNLDFRVGYGFSYSDSERSTFAPTGSLEDIIQTQWNKPKASIDGFYNPFFTPSKQMVNAVIVSIDAKPKDRLKVNFTGNLGFYSTTDNPYLELTVHSNNQYYVDQNFAKETYFPAEIKSSITYNITPQFVVQAVYQYQSTKYYNVHLGGVKAKYLF